MDFRVILYVLCLGWVALPLEVITTPERLEEEHLWDFAEDTSIDAYVHFVVGGEVAVNLQVFLDNYKSVFAVGPECVNWRECDMTFANRANDIIDPVPDCCSSTDVNDTASCMRSDILGAPLTCKRIRTHLRRDPYFDISEPHPVKIGVDIPGLFIEPPSPEPREFLIYPSRGRLFVTYHSMQASVPLELKTHDSDQQLSEGVTIEATKLVDTGGTFDFELKGDMWAFVNLTEEQPKLRGELYSFINADYCCENQCYLAKAPQQIASCNFTPQGHPLWSPETRDHFFPDSLTIRPPYKVSVQIPAGRVPLYMPYGAGVPEYHVMIRFFEDVAKTAYLTKSRLPVQTASEGLTLFAKEPFSQCGTGILEGWDPSTECTECKLGYGGSMCASKCPGFENTDDISGICGGAGRAECIEGDESCFNGCTYGRKVRTPFCTCLVGYAGLSCLDRGAIQQAGVVTSRLSAFPVLFDIAVSGSFAAPVTTLTQLQFIILLGLQFCIPENIRALASGMTPVLNPLHGPLHSSFDPIDDAEHLVHSYLFLTAGVLLHVLIVFAVWVVKRSSGWCVRDCCDLVLFPNLSALLVLLLLANSVQSGAGVITYPSAHHPGIIVLAYVMVLFYTVVVPVFLWVFLRQWLRQDGDVRSRAAYLNRNVANTDQNANRVVYTNGRIEKMPQWLVYFLPWGFWTSQHVPDRKFCRRWDVLFGEFRGGRSDFMFFSVLKFNAFCFILGAKKDTPQDQCYIKMMCLAVVAAGYALFLGREAPYSSRGSNVLHLMVAACNFGTVMSILIDSVGWGTTHAHVFLIMNMCLIILNYIWNILVILLGMTSFKLLHVCPSRSDSTDDLCEAYRKAHFKRADITDAALRDIMTREAVNCDKFNVNFPVSSQLSSLSLVKMASCVKLPCKGTSKGALMWVELRAKDTEAHLLYYRHSEDQEPLGGIDVTLCRVVYLEARNTIQLIVMSTEEKINLCYSTGNDYKYWLQYIEQYSTHASGVQDAGPVLSLRPVSDYEILGSLGSGSYGEVFRVKNKRGQMYAMKKVAPRTEIERQRIMTEVSVLQLIDHPFLVTLHEAMEEGGKVYLILQLLRGGDLSMHLREKQRLSVEQVRFYMAQVTVGLAHLHANSILYRDLKPSNIVLDGKGNAVLTDMGVASYCTRLVSATLAGTPLYQAPEMLDGQPYSQAVDWWAMGIVTFELLQGFPPFNAEQISDVAEMIRLRPVTGFSPACPSEARSLIEALLQKKPKERLISPKRIKHSSFFKAIDWGKLEAGELTPPIIQPLRRAVEYSDSDVTSGSGRDTVSSGSDARKPHPLLREASVGMAASSDLETESSHKTTNPIESLFSPSPRNSPRNSPRSTLRTQVSAVKSATSKTTVCFRLFVYQFFFNFFAGLRRTLPR